MYIVNTQTFPLRGVVMIDPSLCLKLHKINTQMIHASDFPYFYGNYFCDSSDMVLTNGPVSPC